MANIVPEKGINFSAYLEGADCLGVAEGNFPNLEAMTSEVKGAGVAGTVDSIVLGHFSSITATLKWRNTTDHFAKLAAHRTFDLDLYAAHQDYDAGLGEYKKVSLHLFLKAIPKSVNFGNLTVGDTAGMETELEVLYFKIYPKEWTDQAEGIASQRGGLIGDSDSRISRRPRGES